jgi:ATP-dependent Lon protease
VVVTPENLEEFLGVRRFKYGLAEEADQVGVATGLGLDRGGRRLCSPSRRCAVPGKGRMKTTGKLGDVMKESIDAASSFVRSRAPELGLSRRCSRRPTSTSTSPRAPRPRTGRARASPMVTAIVSVLTAIPTRRDGGDDGEVTLRGNVLPIGGLKEKLLAALRGGVKDRADPVGEREGSTRDPGQREERA